MFKRFVLAVAALAWTSGLAWIVPSVAAPATKPDPAPAADPSGPLPLSAFFKPLLISDAQISPGGRALAMVRHDDKAVSLVVEDLGSGVPKAIFGGDPKTTSIDWIRWKGENRLLIGVTYIKVSGRLRLRLWQVHHRHRPRRQEHHHAAEIVAPGELALRHLRRTVGWSATRSGSRADHGARPDGHAAVWRTDVRTGAAEMVDEGDDDTVGWDSDRNGVVVERAERRGCRRRAAGSRAWREGVDRDHPCQAQGFEITQRF